MSLKWLDAESEDLDKVTCSYHDCGASFSFADVEQGRLKAHLLDHFQKKVSKDEFACEIMGCGLETVSEFHARRHLLFHNYHVLLQIRGYLYLKENWREDACFAPAAQSNAISYDGQRQYCRWTECEYASGEDFLEYLEHVQHHAASMDAGDRLQEHYVCQWIDCTRRYPNKHLLLVHMSVHAGGRELACPYCGKCISCKIRLRDHVHRQQPLTKNPNLQCKLCLKYFSSVPILANHTRAHVSNYKCPFCEMTFQLPSYLKRHIQNRHTNIRNYECSVCSKKFKEKAGLQRHLVSKHSNCPFECDVCEQRFQYKNVLLRHKSRVHDGFGADTFLYHCHLCEKRYARGVYLSAHLIRVHKLKRPGGQVKFQYRAGKDGVFRVILERFESADLQQAQTVEPETEDALKTSDEMILNLDDFSETSIKVSLNPSQPGPSENLKRLIPANREPLSNQDSDRVSASCPQDLHSICEYLVSNEETMVYTSPFVDTKRGAGNMHLKKVNPELLFAPSSPDDLFSQCLEELPGNLTSGSTAVLASSSAVNTSGLEEEAADSPGVHQGSTIRIQYPQFPNQQIQLNLSDEQLALWNAGLLQLCITKPDPVIVVDQES